MDAAAIDFPGNARRELAALLGAAAISKIREIHVRAARYGARVCLLGDTSVEFVDSAVSDPAALMRTAYLLAGPQLCPFDSVIHSRVEVAGERLRQSAPSIVSRLEIHFAPLSHGGRYMAIRLTYEEGQKPVTHPLTTDSGAATARAL